MDRLFLAGLVREIAPRVSGRKVRSVDVDESGRRLILSLGTGAPETLCFVLGPAAGLVLADADPAAASSLPRAKKLSRWLGAAVVERLDLSPLDRVVTLTLERTRLSGRTSRVAFVLELTGTRANLFAVDRESERIVDALVVGGLRLAVGERFVALEPPPHAAAEAANVDELEQRLSGESREALLSATGWSPLLVQELRFWMDSGKSVREAFELLRSRLDARKPVLYVGKRASGAGRIPRIVLSPIELAGESLLEARPMPSFNDAMSEAIRILGDAEQIAAVSGRLDAALRKRSKRLRGLRAKLTRQRQSLPDAAQLRRRGETLLAGIGRARRAGDARVRVPDPFDPSGRGEVEVEIDTRLSLAANAERWFRRSRKVERSEVELDKRLAELDHAVAYAETLETSLDDARATADREALEALEAEAEAEGLLPPKARARRRGRKEPRLPPRRFVSSRGHTILVGRSARSNEEVTFRLANPRDLWFHARGMPGSHVVLKVEPPEEASPEEIAEAAAIAAYFSRARESASVDVMVAERRHVSKMKGAPPGLVKVKAHRSVRVQPKAPR